MELRKNYSSIAKLFFIENHTHIINVNRHYL